ncbi:MAG: hypothetical protein SFY56_08775 [Bacteroidota bacterium]|nr:hypothetical protein [Bacteroidota bacterium]
MLFSKTKIVPNYKPWTFLIILYIIMLIQHPYLIVFYLIISASLEILIIIFTIVQIRKKVKYRWFYLILNPIFVFSLFSFSSTTINYLNGTAKIYHTEETEEGSKHYEYKGITFQDFILFNKYRCENSDWQNSVQGLIHSIVNDISLKLFIKNIGFQNNVYKGYVPSEYEIVRELGREDLDTIDVYIEDTLKIKMQSKKLNYQFSKLQLNLANKKHSVAEQVFCYSDTLKKQILFSDKYYPLLILTTGRIEDEDRFNYEQDTLDKRFYKPTFAQLFFIDLSHPNINLTENVDLRLFKKHLFIKSYTEEEMKKKFKYFL